MEQKERLHIGIKLEAFEGPLDLLLKLIEEDKLAITTIAIANVTEQYLHILRTHEEGMQPDLLADFLVIAARLLWYKTRALFPSLADDAPEEEDLELQLKRYQRYVRASKTIEALVKRKHVLFTRTKVLGLSDEPIFTPPPRVSSDAMRDIMRTVIHGLQPLVRHSKEVIKRVVSLRDAIHRVEHLLSSRQHTDFHALLSDAQSRTDIVVTFLAVLELVKQRTVLVRQDDIFGTMVIEKLEILNPRP